MKHIFEYLINRKLTAKDANKNRLKHDIKKRKIFKIIGLNEYFIELTCEELYKLSEYWHKIQNDDSYITTELVKRLRDLYSEFKNYRKGQNAGIVFKLKRGEILLGFNEISTMKAYKHKYELYATVELDLEDITPSYIISKGWVYEI